MPRTWERVADALRGFWFALRHDPGLGMLLAFHALLYAAAGPRVLPWTCVCVGMELMNTAVERLCDFACGGRRDPLIGAVKDMSAAASLACQCAALLVALPGLGR